MADRGARGGPAEHEVREAVRRIVDAVYEPAAASPVQAAAGPGIAAAPAEGAASPQTTIAVGADHGGRALKDVIARTLVAQGHGVTDCGTATDEPVDYPDIAHVVARLVASGACQWGIVVDGAGIGSCMAANKVPGVRAALCYDLSTARNSREHNHANVLTLGARMIGEGLALDIVAAWLATPWGPGRHAARVDKITEIERRYLRAGIGDGTG